MLRLKSLMKFLFRVPNLVKINKESTKYLKENKRNNNKKQ